MPKKPIKRRRAGLGAHWMRLPRWIRFATAWATVVGITAGALISAVKSWEYIEPWWYASHAFVRDTIEDANRPIHNGQVQTNMVLRDIQLDAARKGLDAAVNDIAKWQLELSKPDTPSVAKDLINDRLKNLTDTRENITRQIKTIEKEKVIQH